MPRDSGLSTDEVEAAQTAPFVFFATVRSPGGSNVEALDREEEPSAVVRVDEVVAAPHALGDITGRDVTVRLVGPRLRRSQRLLFMASGLIYGNELGVSEVARVAPGRQASRLREEILEQRLRRHDNELRTRLSLAEIVLYGRIESIQPYVPESEAAAIPPIGEAAPSWRIADLLVWRALKGRPADAPRLLFLYPRTQKWSEMPLFVQGQEGIWLLHSPASGDTGASTFRPPAVTNSFQAPDELDFHAPGSIPRIQILLQMLGTQRSR